MRIPLLALLAYALTPRPVAALDQMLHWRLAENTCGAAGLPSAFCERAGAAAADVDVAEWDDMAAHAQAPVVDGVCKGAKTTLDRVERLGQEIRGHLQGLVAPKDGVARYEAAAAAADTLGRVLHTLHDACSHQGMSNPQHAWYSASDLCGGAASPDADPAAETCARVETETAVEAMTGAMAALGLGPSDLDDLLALEFRQLPPREELCDFIVSGEDWDGIDRRWRPEVVGPALQAAFASALSGERAAIPPDCGELSASPEEAVDISAGPARCLAADALCAGAGGCSSGGPTGGGGPEAWLPLAVLTMGLAGARRRGRLPS